jgi:hypothetical protein
MQQSGGDDRRWSAVLSLISIPLGGSPWGKLQTSESLAEVRLETLVRVRFRATVFAVAFFLKVVEY